MSRVTAGFFGLLLAMIFALPLGPLLGSLTFELAPNLPAAVVGPLICPPQTTPQGRVSGTRRRSYHVDCLDAAGKRQNSSEPALDRWFLICGLVSIPLLWPLLSLALYRSKPTRRSGARRSAPERMAELEALKLQGAVTDDEYERKRRAIVEEL